MDWVSAQSIFINCSYWKKLSSQLVEETMGKIKTSAYPIDLLKHIISLKKRTNRYFNLTFLGWTWLTRSYESTFSNQLLHEHCVVKDVYACTGNDHSWNSIETNLALYSQSWTRARELFSRDWSQIDLSLLLIFLKGELFVSLSRFFIYL